MFKNFLMERIYWKNHNFYLTLNAKSIILKYIYNVN